ncbi:glycerophosphodiester phosphodiesterase [Ilumatobacter sp.]|uniref:glycerophosphodiester phosphodiesterase n=1 Tax=Ilumatobacter sp. TaxID=1967498 RepID=UPI003B522949
MLVIAHRGTAHECRENSPEAFAAADAAGADAVELDVRLVDPGAPRLVVAHDPVEASDPRTSGLDEVLEACGDRMLVNIEIKNSPWDGGHDASMAVVEPTVEAARRHGEPSRFVVSSFSPETVARCRDVAPDIATALLVERPDARAIAAAVAVGHHALHPFHGATDLGAVAACHAEGLAVNVWTCDDPERLVEFASMGVDGACTDAVDVALSALGRGGAAPEVSPRWGTRAGPRRARG